MKVNVSINVPDVPGIDHKHLASIALAQATQIVLRMEEGQRRTLACKSLNLGEITINSEFQERRASRLHYITTPMGFVAAPSETVVTGEEKLRFRRSLRVAMPFTSWEEADEFGKALCSEYKLDWFAILMA